MSVQKIQIITLKRIRFKENDLIIRGLSSQGALISFFAKGACKSKKRFVGGMLEPGHFIGVEYVNSRSSSLHQLRSAWFIKRFEGIRKDYDRLKMGLHFISLVDKIGQEGMEESPSLFNLLGNSLKALETTCSLPALQLVFEFRLLLTQGVLPEELHKQKQLFDVTIAEHEQLLDIFSFKDAAFVVHQAVDHYVSGLTTFS